MKLGYFTAVSDDEICFAKDAGFDGVEARYDRSNPPERATLDRDRATLEQYGLSALTVQWAENYCDYPEPLPVFRDMVRACEVLGAPVMTLNAWAPADLGETERLEFYRKLWSEFARMAADAGIRIGIENCPHDGLNLMATPDDMERLFDLVPDEVIGLEFDPSHFIFQFMDYLEPIREFGDRIHAVHAKDTQIIPKRLDRVGIHGKGWWRFRMPGFGDVDWKALFTALSDIAYDRDIIIEHEDPTYEGHEGLRRGEKFLRQFIL